MMGLQNLRGLGSTLMADYRDTMQLARSTDNTPADRDRHQGEVDFVHDGVHIRADFHRPQSALSLDMTQEQPELGLQTRSIRYEENPASDTLEVTMLEIRDDASQHRTQVDIVVNKATGTITELTTTEWNPADIP